MLNKEYRLLKYIYKHPYVTFQELERKFSNLNLEPTLRYLGSYLEWTKFEESIAENGLYTGDYHFAPDSTFRTSRSGEEYIEKKNHDFLMFFLPYAITTTIALLTVLLDIAILLRS